jgi:hypothetical protein
VVSNFKNVSKLPDSLLIALCDAAAAVLVELVADVVVVMVVLLEAAG